MSFEQKDLQPFFDDVIGLADEGWRPALVVYFKPDKPGQVLMTTHEMFEGKEQWLLEQMLWAAKHKAGSIPIPKTHKE
jgi:hypothetical protein